MGRSAKLFALFLLCGAFWMLAVPGDGLINAQAPSPQPWALGQGVTLSIDRLRSSTERKDSGIISMSVTITNDGQGAIILKYRDLSLSDRAEQRYPALLPAELPGERTGVLLPEGVIGRGHRRSGLLYFRAPPSGAGPIKLRVDLESAGEVPISRTFLPLRLP
jgi:hypothetical protein